MTTLKAAYVITLNDRGLLEQIRRTVREFLPRATVLLFGSIARRTRRADSDYDMLVLSGKRISTREKEASRKAVFDLEVARDVVSSTKFQTKQEWARHPAMPFHIEVDQDRIVLSSRRLRTTSGIGFEGQARRWRRNVPASTPDSCVTS